MFFLFRKKIVTFCELTLLQHVIPLVSGYLQSYACQYPEIKKSYQFNKLSFDLLRPYEQILKELLSTNADVYAFSCYVWNMRLIRRLLADLLALRPNAHFILGGPQVINQGNEYLSPRYENVVICNGEGERTFSYLLKELLNKDRCFKSIKGITYYDSNQLITTEKEERISDLNEIPSPFLTGVFEKKRYEFSVFETNRGCPFKCNYCFWGAATGSKIYQFNEERIKDEMQWIGENTVGYVFIADANWGITQRDVELSQHLAECKKTYNFPNLLYFCTSKNSKSRIEEITNIFSKAGLLATHNVSLQTLSDTALKMVERSNVKMDTYTDLQMRLNENQINSTVELIWPLPGETLNSFMEGIGRLCENNTDTIATYPLILMNNVGLKQKQQEYGLVTVDEVDPASEAQIVVATNQVTRDENFEGVRYSAAVISLYNVRSLWHLFHYLHNELKIKYSDMFLWFKNYCKKNPQYLYSQHIEKSIQDGDHYRFDTIGRMIQSILYSHRQDFDNLIVAFVNSLPCKGSQEILFMMEIDLLNRPYIFRNVPIQDIGHDFKHIQLLDKTENGFYIQIPKYYRELFNAYIKGGASAEDDDEVFFINYRKKQLQLDPNGSDREKRFYCYEMTTKSRDIVPSWIHQKNYSSIVSPIICSR